MQDILDEHPNEIQSFNAVSFGAWERWIHSLAFKPGDTFILDTITLLQPRTLADIRLNREGVETVWDDREALQKDDYQKSIAASVGYIVTKLQHIANKGVYLIVTAHEKVINDKTFDPPVKRHYIDLPPGHAGPLIGSATEVIRLKAFLTQEMNPLTQKIYEPGQRILQLQNCEEFIAKVHVPFSRRNTIPMSITRPSYPRLCKALQKTPRWLVIYGPPGTGKSTFTLSAFLDPTGEGLGD